MGASPVLPFHFPGRNRGHGDGAARARREKTVKGPERVGEKVRCRHPGKGGGAVSPYPGRGRGFCDRSCERPREAEREAEREEGREVPRLPLCPRDCGRDVLRPRSGLPFAKVTRRGEGVVRREDGMELPKRLATAASTMRFMSAADGSCSISICRTSLSSARFFFLAAAAFASASSSSKHLSLTASLNSVSAAVTSCSKIAASASVKRSSRKLSDAAFMNVSPSQIALSCASSCARSCCR